jgi:hypothetical protein
MSRNRKKFSVLAGLRLSALVLLLATSLNAQDLSSRLSQPASYQPKTTTTLQQLIEVAQHYRIPMGIEWIEEPTTDPVLLPEPVKRGTVTDLIVVILQNSPGYLAQQRDGVLQIAKTDFLDNPENFLNLRLPEFQIQDANVFDAESLLRIHILLKLHPGRGFGGGYGYGTPRDDGFDKPTVTFAGNDLKVREILNKIVVGNGNALWVVQFDSVQKMSGRHFRAQTSLNDGQTLPDFHWNFIPLATTKTETRQE